MRDGRMREREAQQRFVAEGVAETALEFGERRHFRFTIYDLRFTHRR